MGRTRSGECGGTHMESQRSRDRGRRIVGVRLRLQTRAQQTLMSRALCMEGGVSEMAHFSRG